MKNIGAVLLLVFATALTAQMRDLEDGMKAVKNQMDALAKMETKSGEKAMESAERLAMVYELMIPYWRARGAADAVKLSEEGKSAATRLASAAFAADAAKADEAFKAIGATCKSCHDAYREKTADGKYRVKPGKQ